MLGDFLDTTVPGRIDDADWGAIVSRGGRTPAPVRLRAGVGGR